MNIPTTRIELAKVLNTSPTNLRKQLIDENGQINFDTETDTLTPEQLGKWLPRYIAKGTKTYLRDETKRQTVEAMLSQLNGNGTLTEPERNPEQKQEPIRTETQTERKTKKKGVTIEDFISLLPILPLPTLGIAASYGVYHFAKHFSPTWVAVFEAVGFELVYIGLSTLRDVPDKFRSRLVGVSIGAVVVSIVYNSLSALLCLNPSLFVGLHFGWQLVISIAHGAPIALLGYFVADLISVLKNHQRK